MHWVILPLVIHLPVIALTFDTKRKQQKTAAEVIKVLHEKSLLEMTPDRVLQGHIYSSLRADEIELWLTLSAKQRRNPCSGLPAVYPDLSTRHDWPVKKGLCFVCRDRQ